MGEERVQTDREQDRRRLSQRRILNDLAALRQIIDGGLIESGVRRIGAEQEVFLVDRSFRPVPAALQLLGAIDDPRFTTELGQFNLELNLDPTIFGGDCLSRLERQLDELLHKLRRVATDQGVEVVLAGILPTLRKTDLTLENMTPKPRYHALSAAMNAERGDDYELHIKGLDELMLKHDSVMLEACNASFQVHFQVGADEFRNFYNIAQAVTGPMLAAAANSPLLFGHQLWRETRIALFQKSVDHRTPIPYLRTRSPRVTFGRNWIRKSVLELFQEDFSRFDMLVATEIESDSLEELTEGRVPELAALRVFNSTVYRWNRACYGISEGKPHLRIENRVLPSGPTVIDEVANAAFWFGLISGISSRYEDVTELLPFESARKNFMGAARLGLETQFLWFHHATLPAARLICDDLLPIARDGLVDRGIDAEDADRYLSVIERRVSSGITGSKWIELSLAGMHGLGSPSERMNALTAATIDRQKQGKPVAQWELARLEEAGMWRDNFLRVEQYMTTDLFTVREEDSLDRVAHMMAWHEVRHIPVEDRRHHLVGLVSYRTLIRIMARGLLGKHEPIRVGDVMKREVVTVTPEASTFHVIEQMRKHRISCLPVVSEDRLVGILTERDLIDLAAELIRDQFAG